MITKHEYDVFPSRIFHFFSLVININVHLCSTVQSCIYSVYWKEAAHTRLVAETSTELYLLRILFKGRSTHEARSRDEYRAVLTPNIIQRKKQTRGSQQRRVQSCTYSVYYLKEEAHSRRLTETSIEGSALGSAPRLPYLQSHKLSIWPLLMLHRVDVWNARKAESDSSFHLSAVFLTWLQLISLVDCERVTLLLVKVLFRILQSFAPLLGFGVWAGHGGLSSGFSC